MSSKHYAYDLELIWLSYSFWSETFCAHYGSIMVLCYITLLWIWIMLCEKSNYTSLIWIWYLSTTKCVLLYILGRNGLVGESDHLRPIGFILTPLWVLKYNFKVGFDNVLTNCFDIRQVSYKLIIFMSHDI